MSIVLMARSKIVLALVFLGMVSGVSAVPDLSVEPSEVNRTGNQSLFADEENRVNLTFINEDSNETIYEVDPRSSGFTDNESVSVKFSESGFNLSAGENKTIEAIIETPEPYNYSETGSIIYEYNTSGGRKTNSSRFPELSFNVETKYERTNLSLNVLQKQFEAGLGETVDSTFDIENEGSERAYEISISANDSKFQFNDFNIDQDDHRLVDYNVTIPAPEINKTGATNQTYVRNVTVSGRNFDQKRFQVEVFVPFKDYNEQERITQEELVEDLQNLENLQGLDRVDEFCNEEGNDELPLCGGEVVVYKNNTKVVTENPEFDDLSTEEILEIANVSDVDPEEYERLQNRVNVLQNNINELKDSVGGDLSQLNETQRQIYENIQEALDERNQRLNATRQVEQERVQFEKNLFTGFGVIALLALLVVGSIKGYRYVGSDELEEWVA